jgi:hypothetical protein
MSETCSNYRLFRTQSEKYTSDSIVNSVISKFIKRSDLGKKKYNTTLDREDLKVKDWITHAQEELMDGILYLEKLKQEIGKEKDLSS